ncbi:MAG: HAMP domain-containing sensor histidine kinase [Cyclobacteriaceae bacterium]
MKRNTIRLIIILGAISMIGIVVTQVFWVKRAFDLKETEFNHKVNIALKNVVEGLCQFNGTDVPTANVVEQMSSNYFTVMVNNMISPEVLEYYLKAEMGKRNIEYDFEYGIYDCSSQQMVYGDYVQMAGDLESSPDMDPQMLPKLESEAYYFGVYFPNKEAHLLSDMGIWTFSSLVLLIVVVFFVYTMFVILKQKRLSEVQRDFINNMTHEFKTPISTIAVSAEVLQSGDIVNQPERLKNYAGIIQAENKRLQKQVDRVLQMAVLDKKVELKKEEVDIHEVIKRVVEGMDVSVNERQGKIECLLKAAQSRVIADKLHLTNVIYNLIDNAIKYCSSVPQIEIITKNLKSGVEIILNDNGIGIDQTEQNKVFNRFYRVPTGNLHDVKGFGLGLNYVKTMIDQHHGQISLKSSPGQGSSFSIYLPFS